MEQNRTLSAIVCDPSLQVRECLDETWVVELSDLYRGNHAMPPITVVFDGTRDLLVDGWHRIEAQRRAWGPDAVIAVVVIDASVSPDPMAVAKMRAAMANREAGLRRTEGDKRRAVLLLRSTPEGRKMKHEEIAKCVGVSRSRVTQILSEGDTAPQVSANTSNNLYGGAPRPDVAALWKQIDDALKEDTSRPDSQIARDVGCTRFTVASRRDVLGLPKSDPKRWREDSSRTPIEAELKRDPAQSNKAIAAKTGGAPETVSKIRDELGLGKSSARNQHTPAAPPPSAPVNPKRTDDPREQGAEVLPLRPPPSRKSDVLTEIMQRFERADRLDQQTIATALYNRWPHFFLNAIEEGREESAVLQ